MISNTDVLKILTNVGIDVTCGACVGQAVTGSNSAPHTCKRSEGTVAEKKQERRDQFAMASLPALINLQGLVREWAGEASTYAMVARDAYRIADYMMIEREREQ